MSRVSHSGTSFGFETLAATVSQLQEDLVSEHIREVTTLRQEATRLRAQIARLVTHLGSTNGQHSRSMGGTVSEEVDDLADIPEEEAARSPTFTEAIKQHQAPMAVEPSTDEDPNSSGVPFDRVVDEEQQAAPRNSVRLSTKRLTGRQSIHMQMKARARALIAQKEEAEEANVEPEPKEQTRGSNRASSSSASQRMSGYRSHRESSRAEYRPSMNSLISADAFASSEPLQVPVRSDLSSISRYSSEASDWGRQDSRNSEDSSAARNWPKRRTAVSANCAGAAAMMLKREDARRTQRRISFHANEREVNEFRNSYLRASETPGYDLPNSQARTSQARASQARASQARASQARASQARASNRNSRPNRPSSPRGRQLQGKAESEDYPCISEPRVSGEVEDLHGRSLSEILNASKSENTSELDATTMSSLGEGLADVAEEARQEMKSEGSSEDERDEVQRSLELTGNLHNTSWVRAREPRYSSTGALSRGASQEWAATNSQPWGTANSQPWGSSNSLQFSSAMSEAMTEVTMTELSCADDPTLADTDSDLYAARLREAWDIKLGADAILNFMLPKRRKSVITASNVATRRSAQYHVALSRTSGVNMFHRSSDPDRGAPLRRGCVLHPQSPIRVAWDFTSMICIGYDLVMIPLEVFNLPKTVFWEVASLVLAAFWTGDMFLSMMTGVYVKGELEMSPCIIVKRYAMTWMFIDIVLILLEWVAYFGGGMPGVAGTTRSARVMRLFRTLRVTRVVKLLPVFSKLEDSIISSSLLLVFKILKLLLGLVLINHIIACAWFAVGDGASEGWTGKETFADANTNYMYLTSLHWAVTQFHGTMQTVEPGTVWERVFAVAVLLVALIVCSAFISSVTSLMLQLQAMQASSTNLKQQMRQFLEDKAVISTRLAVRMKKYIEGKGLAKIMQERQDQFLSIFPETLLMDLHAQLRAPKLTMHPFFAGYGAQYPRIMVKVCHEAVKELDLVSGDVVFHDGDVAEEMYVVAGGCLAYTLFSVRASARENDVDDLQHIMVMQKLSSTNSRSSGLSALEKQEVHREQWVSEAALWVQWEHLGELVASINTALLCVSHTSFARIVVAQEEARTDAVLYARMFRQLLNNESWSDILPVPLQEAATRGESVAFKKFSLAFSA